MSATTLLELALERADSVKFDTKRTNDGVFVSVVYCFGKGADDFFEGSSFVATDEIAPLRVARERDAVCHAVVRRLGQFIYKDIGE